MQPCLAVLLAVLAVTSAYPSVLLTAPAPVLPVGLRSQYHAQDELGQYSYGYTDNLSAKSELKTADGVTRGAYSYVDSAGIIQNVNYVSDAARFRVAASNLPVAPAPGPAVLPAAPLPVVDTPEVAAVKAAHLKALKEEETRSEAAPDESSNEAAEETNGDADDSASEAPAAPAAPSPDDSAASAETESAPAPESPQPAVVAAPAVPASPVIVAAQPAVPLAIAPIAYAPPVPAPVFLPPAPLIAGPIASQYHAQDELGQYSYGYAGGPSAKAELKTFDGITRGGYSYVDANGLVQSANYVADPVNGFRVAASNLPVAPAPVVIPDSPEVAAVKAEHLALAQKAAAEAAAKPE